MPTIDCSVINRDISNHPYFKHPLWGTWMVRQAQQSCELFISSLYKAHVIFYIFLDGSTQLESEISNPDLFETRNF